MRLRPGLRTALFSLLLAATCVVGNDDTPCIVHDNGKIYDLNPLKSKTDYQIVTRKGRKLFFNVCQAVKTETFGLKDDAVVPSEIGAFIRRDHGDFSIGKFNTSMNVFNAEPRFTMAQGSQCTAGNSNPRASSLVSFICDLSVSGLGSPQLIGSLPPGDEDAACAFIIEWKTAYACGISSTGWFWKFITALIVTLLVLLASYAILGTLYNRFMLNLQGLDSIPQFSFQSMLYHTNEVLEWTKDVLGILLVNYCSPPNTGGGGGSGRRGGRGYNILPSHDTNPRTPNPVSHQAQVFGIVNRGTHDEPEQPAGGGFTRPIPSPRPAQQQQQQLPATNPVSHHTQSLSQALSPRLPVHPHTHPSQSQLQLQTSTSGSPPPPPPQTHPQPPTGTRTFSTTAAAASQEEERPFMLFSNDEDQAQDLDGTVDGDAAGETPSAPAIQL